MNAKSGPNSTYLSRELHEPDASGCNGEVLVHCGCTLTQVSRNCNLWFPSPWCRALSQVHSEWLSWNAFECIGFGKLMVFFEYCFLKSRKTEFEEIVKLTNVWLKLFSQ